MKKQTPYPDHKDDVKGKNSIMSDDIEKRFLEYEKKRVELGDYL